MWSPIFYKLELLTPREVHLKSYWKTLETIVSNDNFNKARMAKVIQSAKKQLEANYQFHSVFLPGPFFLLQHASIGKYSLNQGKYSLKKIH